MIYTVLAVKVNMLKFVLNASQNKIKYLLYATHITYIRRIRSCPAVSAYKGCAYLVPVIRTQDYFAYIPGYRSERVKKYPITIFLYICADGFCLLSAKGFLVSVFNICHVCTMSIIQTEMNWFATVTNNYLFHRVRFILENSVAD